MQIHLNLRFNILFKDKLNSQNGTIFTKQIVEYLADGVLFCSSNFNKSYIFSGLNDISNNNVKELLEKIEHLATYIMQIRASSEVKINNFYSHPVLLHSLNDYDFAKIKKFLLLFTKMMFDFGALKIYLPFKKKYVVENYNEAKKYIYKITKVRT